MRFPDEGSVFDYFIDPNTKKGEPKRCSHWREIIPEYKHDRAETYAKIFVPTMDSTRALYIANMMLVLESRSCSSATPVPQRHRLQHPPPRP